MYENKKKYIEAAKTLNEAVKEAERKKLLLDEAAFSIPKNDKALESLKAAAQKRFDDKSLESGLVIDPGIKFTIRRRDSGGGRAGAASKHACTVKHYLYKSAKGDEIHVPQKCYYDYGKKKHKASMLDKLYALKSYSKDGEALFRCICDNQALLAAIWFAPDAKTERALILMLVDKIAEKDYYGQKVINGPKSNEELEKDRAEIEARLNNSGK